MPKKLTKGESYHPAVTVKKMKGTIPTVIEVSGRRYVYEPRGK